MTPNEFKFWFEGFTESIEKQPTLKQWARIKARVKEINGTSVVYVDRYRPYWYTPAVPMQYISCSSATTGGGGGSVINMTGSIAGSSAYSVNAVDVESMMRAIGKADAEEVAA